MWSTNVCVYSFNFILFFFYGSNTKITTLHHQSFIISFNVVNKKKSILSLCHWQGFESLNYVCLLVFVIFQGYSNNLWFRVVFVQSFLLFRLLCCFYLCIPIAIWNFYFSFSVMRFFVFTQCFVGCPSYYRNL